MIFPDKPRPPWQYAKPKPVNPRRVIEQLSDLKPQRDPKPPGYWRERIEFGLLCIGFYFWVLYWMQFK